MATLTSITVLTVLTVLVSAADIDLSKNSNMLRTETRIINGRAEEVCTTTECTSSASAIIEAMDLSVSPCDDFFQFACGGWIANHPVPSSESRWDQFEVLQTELTNAISNILEEPLNKSDPLPINQAKWFYTTCLNVETIEILGVTPLSELLATHDGWPLTKSIWVANFFDWQETVAAATRDLGISVLIEPYVFADERSTSDTILYIDQPFLDMPRSILTSPQNYESRFLAYKKYIKSTAQIVASSLGETVFDGDLNSQIEDLVDFEILIAHLTTPDEDRRDVDRMYNLMTVGELQNLTPGSSIDWVSFLSSVFIRLNTRIDSSTKVVVTEIDYIQNLAKLLEISNKKTVSNFILWKFVQSLGDETNEAMRSAVFEYNKVVLGVSAEFSRTETCSNKANDYVGMAIGVPYVHRYFSSQAKIESSNLIEDLRESFKNLLSQNEWMDEETKPVAIEKADAISKFIGYPDWYDEPNGLVDYYENLTAISAFSTHFENIVEARKWYSGTALAALGLPSDHTRWMMTPTTVNAYYMPEFNSITFPAGILQPPFYRANTLQAINYGGIGHVMGHEITHGFDDQGSQNDKEGNAIPWWSNATLEAFREKAQCVINQYDNYSIPDIDYLLPNAAVNGVTTQGENIADNGGLREAYLAYQLYVQRNGVEPLLPGLEQFTPNQIFFLGNANMWCSATTDEGLLEQILTNPHSPARFRVRGPMSNMEQFSEEWDCPAGSGMNPVNKCIVW